MLKVGDPVKFFRYETVDGKSAYVPYHAIVLGLRPRPVGGEIRVVDSEAGSLPKGSAPQPIINLVCLNPGDLQHLQSAEWYLCMARHFDIVPESEAGIGVEFYRETPETVAAAHAATGEDKYSFPTLDEAKEPSDADLDATVKEEEIKDSTGKPPAKVRVVKGSKGE